MFSAKVFARWIVALHESQTGFTAKAQTVQQRSAARLLLTHWLAWRRCVIWFLLLLSVDLFMFTLVESTNVPPFASYTAPICWPRHSAWRQNSQMSTHQTAQVRLSMCVLCRANDAR